MFPALEPSQDGLVARENPQQGEHTEERVLCRSQEKLTVSLTGRKDGQDNSQDHKADDNDVSVDVYRSECTGSFIHKSPNKYHAIDQQQ